jgi:hypothetical protein
MNEESLFGIVENVAENDIKDDTSSAKSGPSTTRSGLQKVKTMSNMSDMSVKMSDSFKGAAKLDTGRDFLDWLVRMESNIQAEKNSHFNVYYDRICELSTSTKELQEQVDKGILKSARIGGSELYAEKSRNLRFRSSEHFKIKSRNRAMIHHIAELPSIP